MISDRAIRAALDRFRLATPADSTPRPTHLQVVLDASLSMTSGDGSKEQRARELSILLLKLTETAGLSGCVLALRGSDRNRIFESAHVGKLVQIPFDGVQALGESWGNELSDRPSPTWRVVVSDFLFPGIALPFVQKAAASMDRLWLVQLLDDWELHPSPAGASSLVDIETEEAVELILDQSAIDRYVARLGALCGRLADACRTVGASWTSVSASLELNTLCQHHLVPAGLLVGQRP